MTLSESLTYWMNRNGYKSLNALSVESKVPYATLRDITKGITENVRLSTLKALAHTFGVTLDEVVEGPKEKAPAQNEQELSEVDLQLLALPEDVKQTVLLLVTQVAAQIAPTVRVSELTARRIQQAIPQDQDSQQQIGDQEQQTH